MNEQRSSQTLSLSEAQTHALGAELGAQLRPGDVVALRGELGAGKTRLVRGLAAGLGLDPAQVSSPTYVLAQVYRLGLAGGVPARCALVHVDAYRLRGEDDMDLVGWDRLADGSGVIAIEWPERLGEFLERQAVRLEVTLAHEGPEARRIDVVWHGGAGLRAAGASAAARPCPTCGGSVAPGAPSGPFCSERCRMADLSKWFGGAYKLSRRATDDDLAK